MSARAVRAVVLLVCGAGTAGMIATSVTDRDGAALTLGLITAAAVVCLIAVTAVGAGAPSPPARTAPDDARAARVEQLVEDLVAAGAEEAAVRELVGEAVRLGRSGRR